jgi:hypothetical protein
MGVKTIVAQILWGHMPRLNFVHNDMGWGGVEPKGILPFKGAYFEIKKQQNLRQKKSFN